jgi:DNA-binding NtrC family response regulator
MAKKRAVILLVDDDDGVLDVAAVTLASVGYQVIRATNGEAALEIIKYDQQIDLLMTDIVMPGTIDGWELANRAKQLRPEMSVLYMTGHGEILLPDENQGGFGPLLPKPWRSDQLVGLVNRALRYTSYARIA